MSQRAKRKIKPPQYLDEYELGTKQHSQDQKLNGVKVKHSDQAESNMECSVEGDENITFIPPKPKKAKLNKVVNPMDPNELLNPGGVWNPENIISSGIK